MIIKTQIHGKKILVDVPSVGTLMQAKNKITFSDGECIDEGDFFLIRGYETNGIELCAKVRNLNLDFLIPVRQLNQRLK